MDDFFHRQLGGGRRDRGEFAAVLDRREIPGRAASARRGWSRKFAAAARGVVRAVAGQSSFAVHIVAAVAAVALAAVLRVSAIEWGLLAVAIGGVFVAEIFNTAIESLARGPGSRRHPRLRDALDMAAGGVLVAAATALAVGIALFCPRILALLREASL